MRGGSIYFDCSFDRSGNCSFELDGNVFKFTKALYGGVVYYLNQGVSKNVSNVFGNNSAQYGPIVGSYPVKILPSKNPNRQLRNDTHSIMAYSGQKLLDHLQQYIYLYDQQNQLITINEQIEFQFQTTLSKIQQCLCSELLNATHPTCSPSKRLHMDHMDEVQLLRFNVKNKGSYLNFQTRIFCALMPNNSKSLSNIDYVISSEIFEHGRLNKVYAGSSHFTLKSLELRFQNCPLNNFYNIRVQRCSPCP